MRYAMILLLLFLVLAAAAGAEGPWGAIAGSLVPPDAEAQISALAEGQVVATTKGGGDGKYRLELAAGTYTIVVTAPVSSFPVRLEGVAVRPGETAHLPPVLILAGAGRAVLEGRVVPSRPDSTVTLLQEGKERASVRTDSQGGYAFPGLPAGTYEVRASAPGHATDAAPAAVPENQRVRHDPVLLPVVATGGVDWERGTVRASGVGSPPRSAENEASRRAMTERAAVADAQRNLLRTIGQIRMDDSRTVDDLMGQGSGRERIRGFVAGARVVSKRHLGDGRIEVILEAPLTGPSGLSRVLAGP